MSEFHATLTPGTLNNTNETLTVSFDSPDLATNVVVSLFEVDRWGTRRDLVTEDGGPDDFIAEFHGPITDGTFQGRLVRQGRARRGAPTIHVRIDGDNTVHALQVPSGGNEHEDGVLEIQLRVRGRIGRRQKRFVSEAPAFVRNFQANRPVVAFVTGTSGGYFVAANAYWRAHADGKFQRGSLEEILEFVRREPEHRGYGTWGEINIVSHGNELEWIIRLFRRDRSVQHVTAEMLEQGLNDPRLAAPDAAQVDGQTRVVIRGCAIGNDQRLLNAICRAFGGDATVFAPRYLQFYAVRRVHGETITREGFWEFFYFYTPGGRIPNETVCIRELGNKYADRNINDAEWRRMLRDREHRKNRVESVGPYTFDQDSNVRRQRGSDFRPEVRQSYDANPPTGAFAGTAFDEWGWAIRTRERRLRGVGWHYFISGMGRRARVEVRRELRDANGDPVIPDITNPHHYGRAPAWPH